jgi:hypothetical protein
MRVTIKRIVKSTFMIALFLCLFIKPISGKASSVDQTNSVTSASITSYAFNAHAGDSLSLITRRALQLRGVTDKSVAMYCENQLSSNLGGGYLEIDQQVVVTYAQLDNCVAASKGLSESERAAWLAYANDADFDISYITPTNNSSNVVTPKASDSTSPSPSNDPSTSQSPAAQTPNKTTPTKKAPNYWWYIGGGALVTIYFVLGGTLPRRQK